MTTVLPTHNTSPHALDRSTALSILSSPPFELPIGNSPLVQDKGFSLPFKQPQIFVKPTTPLNEQNKIVTPQPLGEQVMKQEIHNDLNKGQLSWASDAYNQTIKKRRLSGGASPSPKPYDSKVPRPPNAFIIYHRTKSKELAAVKRSVSDDRHPSKTVAEMWREEPEHIKLRYQREADLALVEHKKKYPFYKYKPKKNKGKGKEGQNSSGSSDNNKNEDEKNVDQVPIEHRKQASMESAFTVFDLEEEKKPIQPPQPRILTLQQQSAAQITSQHASQHACIPETPNTPTVISWDNVLHDSLVSGQFASVHAQPEQGQLSNYAQLGTEPQIQFDSQLNGGQFPLTGERLIGAEFTDASGTIISEQAVIEEILKLILSQGAYNSATLTSSGTSDMVTPDISALFARDSASVASENSNHISPTSNIINTPAAAPTPTVAAPVPQMMTPPFQSLDNEFKFYEDISCNPNPSSTSNPMPLSQPSLSSNLSINLPQDAWVMSIPGVVPMTTATAAAAVAPPTPTTPLGFAPWSGVGGGACSNCGSCSKIPLQTIHEGKVAQSVNDFPCDIVNMTTDVMEGVVVPVQHVQHNELQTTVQTTPDGCWGFIV
ncbi:7345_t:CDS:2 [Paraglomus occultum]|uniref:7345_t:CDS:1 n=1 Tax=Paraglomus occultum TaxID=144539 RepID=A0A9N9F5B6_9GLOM|nr:7345_t:CDS:2 [Paraglomus occultum]